MSFWVFLIQMAINLSFLLAFFLVWVRLKRPQDEDPRFKKGLQLLQSKISILEDLSDRTDLQVRQLTSLMTSKVNEVQEKIEEADRQILEIEKSMQKSLEVAKIFQDKIPHEEIIERQTSMKYMDAARLAEQGVAAQEIAEQLDIPLAEVEIIVSMNQRKDAEL